MSDRTLIDEIKRRVTLVQVIDKFGGAELQGDGDKRVGWHKVHESESKTSLHVDNVAGVWHCKNCGQGGDAFSWVGHSLHNGTYRDNDKVMFAEAMRAVAALAGVEIPEHDAAGTTERRNIEGTWQIAADFYHGQLTDAHREYFHGRGYTDETIDKYKLGFAPKGPHALLAHLVEKYKIDGDELAKSGLFTKRYGRLEDHFQGRLMFPYINGGRVTYFIGRETNDSPQWEQEKQMKYKKLLVHSDNNPYVSEVVSNRYFYGEDSVKPGADLLITEGVADCVSALQAGFNCVSPVTVRFAKKDWPRLLELAQRAGTIYICNDSEQNNAGGGGALATAQMLWKYGKQARMVTLPRPADAGKIDLNDFLNSQGPDALNALFASAKTLLDLKLDELKEAEDQAKKIEFQKEVFALLAYIDDEFVREQLRSELPKVLGVTKAAYDKFLDKAIDALPVEAADKADDDMPLLSEVITKALAAEGYTFRMNELADTIEVNGAIIGKGITAEIRTKMRDLGWRKVEEIEDVYTTIAFHNRYHPVKQYLESLVWDGQNHIRRLGSFIEDDHPAIVYPSYPDNPVSAFDVFMGRWLIGSVAKVYESGHVKAQNPVLVLDGPQNLGKSSFVRWLGSPLRHLTFEGPIRPDDKEHHRYLSSMWIWEISELGATTRKADREALKDFITKHEVTFRVPYEPHPVTKPALTSFIGTINNENGFLTDPTGNRRFMIVRLKSIDWHYLKSIDIDQLWAQAYALYKQGEPWTLRPEEIAVRDNRNTEYMVEDAYEGWILKYYNVDPDQPGWRETSNDIALRLQNEGMRGETKKIQMDISATLKRMGLRQDSNARPRAWVGIRSR